MKYETFVGMGHNPDGPDIPVGFGMQLTAEPAAMHAYSALSNTQKEELIQYMQAATTGSDSEYRVMHAVEKLKNNQVQELLSGSHGDRYY